MKRVFRTDCALKPDVIDAYAKSYFAADPVAEEFVKEVYLSQEQAAGRQMFEGALANGVEAVDGAPDSLRRLFEEVERPPDWLEWEKVELGARVFRRWGTHLYSFAGAITLHGYRENSVAKPLALTGAYTGESAQRRFLETAQFWIDVSEPGGLRAGAEGRRTALRVRIMHVFVRARLMEHPEWDLSAWGVPISQGDALLTLMGGSFLPGYGLRILGYRTTREEIEATLHFWRYVGHLVGVQPAWYPASIEEAAGLIFTASVKGADRAGEDATNLAHSYLESYAPVSTDRGVRRLVRWWDYSIQRGYLGLFLPSDSRRKYALPSAGLWALHPFVQFPWIFLRETLRRRSTRVDDWCDRRARQRTQRWVRDRLGERAPEYRAVDQFQR